MKNLELLEELFEMEAHNGSAEMVEEWIAAEGSQLLQAAFQLWSAKRWDSVEHYLDSVLDSDQIDMLETVKTMARKRKKEKE